jgi:hypothetical protein
LYRSKGIGSISCRLFRLGWKTSGEWNTINGLAPLGLFLKTVGIRQIGKNEVILDGINPFPWPVTVKYQGMTITCHSQDVVVHFPLVTRLQLTALALIGFPWLYEEAKDSDKGEQTNE